MFQKPASFLLPGTSGDEKIFLCHALDRERNSWACLTAQPCLNFSSKLDQISQLGWGHVRLYFQVVHVLGSLAFTL